MTFTDHNGRSVNLDRKLGSGGEADIYALSGHSDQVAKIYFAQSSERSAKLQAMVASPPVDPTVSQGHVSICWPEAVLFKQGTRGCAGFLMHRVDFSTNVPVLQLYNPQDRQRVAPGFTWGYLVGTASNIASVVEAVHACGYVVGDLNESNFLVSDRALVTLVDCDSMQVPNASGGVFRCTVGKPDFTAPELQACDFSQIDRDSTHDNFALGVMVFHLLMEGVHPYAGIWRGVGDPPPLEYRIRTGDCPYVGSGRVVPMPTALPFDVLSSPLKSLFVRCFQYGHNSPTTRPYPHEWREALNALERNLIPCTRNRTHIYPNHLQKCPWCERAAILGGFDAYPLRTQQRPLQTASFTARQVAASPMPPPLPTQPPTRTASILPAASVSTVPSRGWASALGWIVFVVVLIWGEVLQQSIGSSGPDGLPWLAGSLFYSLFGTSALTGVFVWALLRRKKNRAVIAGILGAVSALTFFALLGVSGRGTETKGEGTSKAAASAPNKLADYTSNHWVVLALGEKKEDFALNTDHRLSYRNVTLRGFKIEGDGAWVSPASPVGDVLCFSLGKGILINLPTLNGVIVLDEAKLAFGLSAVQWTSWSPDGMYWLVAHYNEAQWELFVVNARTHESKRFPISLRQKNSWVSLGSGSLPSE